MNEIIRFLSTPNQPYEKGLAIYHKVKKDSSKDGFFTQVQSAPKGSLHHNLLISELKAAARILRDVSPPKAAPKPTRDITAKALPKAKTRFAYNKIVDVKSLPEDLQKRYFENQELTRKLSGMHQELRSATTDHRRKELAWEIKGLTKKRQENWKVLDGHAKGKSKKGKPKKQHPKIAQYKKELASGNLTKRQIAYRERMIKQWTNEK